MDLNLTINEKRHLPQIFFSEFDPVKVRKQTFGYSSPEECQTDGLSVGEIGLVRGGGINREQVIFSRRTRPLFYQLQVNSLGEYAQEQVCGKLF